MQSVADTYKDLIYLKGLGNGFETEAIKDVIPKGN